MRSASSIHTALSRRRLLRLASLAGALGLASCLRAPVPSPAPVAATSPAPIATALPTPSPTAAAAPALVAEELFDETRLSPVVVALDATVTGYPAAPPFDPAKAYPEYPFAPEAVGPENGAYALLRRALAALEPEGHGGAGWNPLGGIVYPGDTVLVKPNLVDATHWEAGQITHPAFLRAVVDYVYLACGPGGRIILADGPWKTGLFTAIAERTGLRPMADELARRGMPIELQDLNDSAPDSTPTIDLGETSAFHGVERTWYDAHKNELPAPARYRIARAVLAADAVISVPKIKVHCTGGLTLNLKNMLGIIPAWDGHADGQLKDCAHSSDADVALGERGLYVENDTIWRSMADLNRILLYVGADGRLAGERQRRYLAIVDGVVAGEASQYAPVPRPLGAVVIGRDPVAADAVAARVAGFDPRRLRSVVRAAGDGAHALGPSSPAGIRLTLAGASALNEFCTADRVIAPESGVYSWVGQVEAQDFDPPQLSWRYDAPNERLAVQAADAAGVAYVRLRYRRLGKPRLKALALSEGTPGEGVWATPLAAPGQIDEVWLEASDELFNAVRAPLAL